MKKTTREQRGFGVCEQQNPTQETGDARSPAAPPAPSMLIMFNAITPSMFWRYYIDEDGIMRLEIRGQNDTAQETNTWM